MLSSLLLKFHAHTCAFICKGTVQQCIHLSSSITFIRKTSLYMYIIFYKYQRSVFNKIILLTRSQFDLNYSLLHLISFLVVILKANNRCFFYSIKRHMRLSFYILKYSLINCIRIKYLTNNASIKCYLYCFAVLHLNINLICWF